MRHLNHFRTSVACFFAAAIVATVGTSGLADVHYVDVNNTNSMPPYSTWVTAATNIQDAIDAAVPGDEIVVTNGIYATGARIVESYMPNRVAVDKPLSLRSINGPQLTTIDGGQSNRCVYLTNGATLSGFTLTSGYAPHGAGVFCESASAVVSNCVVSGNAARDAGGGAYGGTIINCLLSGNEAPGSYEGSRTVATGGGAVNATLNNCTLIRNFSVFGGGAYGSTLNNCIVIGNQVEGYDFDLGTSFGSGGGVYSCTLNNSTVCGNSAVGGGGGVAGGGTVNNCIVYFNNSVNGSNYNYSGSILYYCCTMPLPRNGVGNIASMPLLVDTNGWANLRLQPTSPCINAGNNAFAPNDLDLLDLDGNPRIKGDTVDIGAYEFQLPTSTISYAWLQQRNLPIDGSADAADPDGDGLNNWQEWRCGTDPTNAFSALRMLAPVTAGTNIAVTWQSVTGVSYFLERSTSLATSAAFASLATNIPGQLATTTYTDTNAIGSGPWFYRVGVGN